MAHLLRHEEISPFPTYAKKTPHPSLGFGNGSNSLTSLWQRSGSQGASNNPKIEWDPKTNVRWRMPSNV